MRSTHVRRGTHMQQCSALLTARALKVSFRSSQYAQVSLIFLLPLFRRFLCGLLLKTTFKYPFWTLLMAGTRWAGPMKSVLRVMRGVDQAVLGAEDRGGNLPVKMQPGKSWEVGNLRPCTLPQAPRRDVFGLNLNQSSRLLGVTIPDTPFTEKPRPTWLFHLVAAPSCCLVISVSACCQLLFTHVLSLRPLGWGWGFPKYIPQTTCHVVPTTLTYTCWGKKLWGWICFLFCLWGRFCTVRAQRPMIR